MVGRKRTGKFEKAKFCKVDTPCESKRVNRYIGRTQLDYYYAFCVFPDRCSLQSDEPVKVERENA